MTDKDQKKRVCYVVCYKDPDYIRTKTLVAGLKKIEDVELVVIKNKYKNFLRYIEVPFKLLMARLRFKPDVFIVGFRAYEIFWALYPSMVRKEIIFDEFINLHDWLVNEHKKFSEDSFVIKFLDAYMSWVIKKCKYVLTDTEANAELSSKIYKISRNKVKAIPVGADEEIFYPRPKTKKSQKFEVFFYGTMLPLHGLDVILDAIVLIKKSGDLGKMHFTLAGGRGNKKMMAKITIFIKENELEKYVTHLPWIEYKKLPEFIANADLCLGGPFGGTGQAKRVITGKTYQFLAMAKPTIVGKIDENPGFINGQNCILVEQKDAQKLSLIIESILDKSIDLGKISMAARELYQQKFSARIISQRQEILF